MSDCVHCAHEVGSVDDACLWCGLWQNGHMPMCETHATAPSVGLCVVCARPVCGACATRIDGRLFCADAGHRSFAAEHTLVASFESEFDADWVRTLLARSGISSRQFSFRDHASSWWFPLRTAVRLFIPTAQVDEARSILADMDDLTHTL